MTGEYHTLRIQDIRLQPVNLGEEAVDVFCSPPSLQPHNISGRQCPTQVHKASPQPSE